MLGMKSMQKALRLLIQNWYTQFNLRQKSVPDDDDDVVVDDDDDDDDNDNNNNNNNNNNTSTKLSVSRN
jgi:hypothetical protein